MEVKAEHSDRERYIYRVDKIAASIMWKKFTPRDWKNE